jgi:UrcA family protein
MHSHLVSVATVVALAVGVSASAQASAQKGVIPLTQYDLATAAGQAQLDRAISRTALGMCATESTVDAPQAKHLERLCYEDAVARAHAQISARTAMAPSNSTLAALDPSAKRN